MIRFKKQEEDKPAAAKPAPKAATETAKPKPAAAKRKKAESGDDATLDFATPDDGDKD